MSVILRNNASNSGGGSGSGKGFPPGDVILNEVRFDNSKVLIKWQDPDATIINGTTITEWKSTLIVRKAGSYPNSIKDGVLVIENDEKNKYIDTFFEDIGLTNGEEYYYRIFTRSVDNSYNDSTNENTMFHGSPVEYSTVFGENTWDQIHDVIQRGIHQDVWSIGDEIVVNYREATVTGNFNSSSYKSDKVFPAGKVVYEIADFNRPTGLTEEQFVMMENDSSTNQGNNAKSDYIFKYPSENPKNIVLVVKTISPVLTNVSGIGYFDGNWCYPGTNSPLSVYTTVMENYTDIPIEYLEDIMWYGYYWWPTSILQDSSGKPKTYWIKQKFMRLAYDHIGTDINYYFGKRLSIFETTNNRIFKDASGTAFKYDLLSDCYILSTGSANSSHVSTSGNVSTCRTGSEDYLRCFCVIK